MSKVIPKRVLEDIRFRSDIVDVIGSYFNLQRAGSAFKATCPFHKEKTPSFHVNPQRQIFHCFGCGTGGDVFRFVMQYEGVDFMGAIKILAHRAGIKIELEEGEEGGSDKAALYQLHADVAAFFHHELLEGKRSAAAKQYLVKRDLARETVEEFQIGYAPEGWDVLINWAHQKKYTTDLLEKAGLILRKDKPSAGSGEFYDRFRNRLMFPIFDEQSRVIGFSGRTMDDKDKTAKYINSPETLLFKKSRVLYALDKARRHIVESREAIICEGQIDVIRCHQAGFKTAVASQGTAFTEEHVRILRRYADSVVIIFDTDKAGQDASIRTSMEFMDAGMAVRVGVLPEKEDPDSYIRKKGAEGFSNVVNQAGSAVAYQVRVLSTREDAKSEIGAMRIAKAVLQTISHSPNAVQRAKLVQEVAERLNIPATALQEDLRFMQRKAGQQSTATARSDGETAPEKEQPKEEIQLCEHMANVMDHPELVDLVKKYLPLSMIHDPICRLFVEACLESVAAGRTIQDVINDKDDKSGELQNFVARTFMTPTKITGQETSHGAAVKDLILYIWRRKLEKERAAIDKNPDAKSEERRRQITYDLKSLKKWDDGALIIEFELSS
ncbi:MAG: DNA primase [Kiritimatiellae bacterium]|nr:DNA primase [Kiritimatiellia bacterium]MDD5519644.1 DNA primase [Kiritimatiellia bacterium]